MLASFCGSGGVKAAIPARFVLLGHFEKVVRTLVRDGISRRSSVFDHTQRPESDYLNRVYPPISPKGFHESFREPPCDLPSILRSSQIIRPVMPVALSLMRRFRTGILPHKPSVLSHN